MKLLLALPVLALCGCGFRGEFDHEKAAAVYDCVDHRDGERMSFNSADVRNVVWTPAGACADIPMSNGVTMNLCKVDEAYMKCKPRVTQ